MEKKMENEQLAGATVYTTLEPCADRTPPKKSCADRLIERQVSRVLIGFLDPDDRGQGYHKLLDANIAVELFPDQDLVAQIRELNRRFIDSRRASVAKAKRGFAGIASTTSPAFFGRPDEVLGQVGEHADRTQYTIEHGPAFYLRIIPTVRSSMPFAEGDQQSKIATLRTFGSTFGGIPRSNDHGVIFFEPLGTSSEIASLSQAFRNGEVWGINVAILREGSTKHPPLVFLRLIEKIFYNSIRYYCAFLSSLDRIELPYSVEAGLVGIKNRTLAVFDASAGIQYPGNLYQDEIILRSDLSSIVDKTLDGFLLEFFQKVYEQTGYHRPAHLFGFPGATPYTTD